MHYSAHLATNPEFKPSPDDVARQAVDTFLTHEEVIKELEFTAKPQIIHVDSFPHTGKDSKVDFQLYGGTKCFWKPCSGSVWFNHKAKPEPEYHGEVYQQGKLIVEWKMEIEGGMCTRHNSLNFSQFLDSFIFRCETMEYHVLEVPCEP